MLTFRNEAARWEFAVKFGFVLVLLCLSIKLLSQSTPSVPTVTLTTNLGTVQVSQCVPGVLTFTHKDASVDVTFEHLDYIGDNLYTRAEGTLKMSNDAAVPYATFIKENDLKDTEHIRGYYEVCVSVRSKLLTIMPEKTLDYVAFETCLNF